MDYFNTINCMGGEWDALVRKRILEWLEPHAEEMGQKRLGQAVGWSQSSVSGYLRGEGDASLDHLAAFARVFERRMEDLFSDHPSKPDPTRLKVMTLWYGAGPTGQDLAEKILRDYAMRGARPKRRAKSARAGKASGPADEQGPSGQPGARNTRAKRGTRRG